MEIKLTEEFKIIQCTNAPFLWDLYRIRAAKEMGKQYETAEAYGIDLKGVAERVPYFEVEDKANKPVSFKEFVGMFEKEQKQIIEAFLKQVKEK